MVLMVHVTNSFYIVVISDLSYLTSKCEMVHKLLIMINNSKQMFFLASLIYLLQITVHILHK